MLKSEGRQLRLKDHHGRTIGGFPANTLKEDATGLWGRGEINLNVQQGSEAYSLARQKVLVDFSIGFTAVKFTREGIDDSERVITEAIAWEGSIVDEPMNPKANIVNVKNLEQDNMTPITEDEVKEFTKRDLEDALRDETKTFTKKAAIMIASLFDGQEPADEKAARLEKENDEKQLQEDAAWERMNDEIKSISTSLKE